MSDMTIYLILVLILGLVIGSFLNVVIYRLPIMMERQWLAEARQMLDQPMEKMARFNLCTPHSACPHCQKTIKPWQNIPVLSYLLLRGRCANCSAPIGLRYPLVESLTALMYVLVIWQYGITPIGVGGLLLTTALIALTFIDMDTQLLPDQITLPLLWCGLLFNWYTHFIPLSSALWGAVLGYMSLWVLFWLFKLLTGKDGMGYGDFKLLAALGAWLGVATLPIVVFMAALVGIIASIILKISRGQPMAFGPALAIAGWVVWIADAQMMQLVHWWLQLSGLSS